MLQEHELVPPLSVNNSKHDGSSTLRPTPYWAQRMFFAAFFGAIAASVMMTVHELKVKGTGHENVVVPALMTSVQAFKLPELYYKNVQRGWNDNTLRLLCFGTVVALISWLLALLVASNAI